MPDIDLLRLVVGLVLLFLVLYSIGYGIYLLSIFLGRNYDKDKNSK